MNMSGLEIVRVTDSNIHQAYYLYKQGLSGSLNKDDFRRKYDTSYLGVNNCSHMAFKSNRPVGFYGVTPCQMIHNGNVFLSAKVTDSIVAKEYRGKGLYGELGKLSYDSLKNYGCEFVYGLNSHATYYASKKFGWNTVSRSIFYFKIPLRKSYLYKGLRKIMPRSHQNNVFKRTFKDLILPRRDYTNPLNKEGTSILYSDDYLNYKTFSENHLIKIGNVRIWLKVRSFLDIGSVSFENESELISAFEVLFSLSKNLFINDIFINACFGTRLYRFLEKQYTPVPSWMLGYINLHNDHAIDGAGLIACSADLDTF